MGRVITIGRQFGSGGHEVGLRLAKRLGIPFYDKEIITLTAENSRFAESYLKKMDEQKPNFLNIGSTTMVSGAGVSTSAESAMNQFYHLSPNDQIFLAKSKVMQDLAAKGPCVIVGRCADYILRDLDPVNFFIYADLKDRVERKLALEEHAGMTAQAMEKLIKNTDKNRSKFYEYYSHQVWGDAKNYNLCIDTSSVGVDGAVEIMMKFIEEFRKKNILPDK
ncbi:MAG: cytidylate kinase-like family protein [Sphaerochaetaceae bacterium]|nr:cytidylate kinase-like family protein [Sphaerochaetaceae bacterium]